ncbi:MAG: tRNA (guanosine(46)-N7)-methyltransferase TrmB [Bacteroidota bacterium]
MGKKKLVHFQENLTFNHLFQPAYPELEAGFFMRGEWNQQFFRNSNPIILELGCGKGEYTVGLAKKYPQFNFIGIDLKGARLWRGCKTIEEEGIQNAAFIRTRVDHIEKFFNPGEISGIWITFPDPQPGKERKRLTSPFFLSRYKNILNKEGIIHLKTDDFPFYQFTLETIGEQNHKLLYSTGDLYDSGVNEDVVSVQTYYEKIWLEMDKKICYVKFQL